MHVVYSRDFLGALQGAQTLCVCTCEVMAIVVPTVPTIQMKQALYGHPDAGTFWEWHCDSKLRKKGFTRIETWDSTYFCKELVSLLFVYVAHMVISGPTGNHEEGWQRMKDSGLMMEDATDPGL